MSVPGLIPGTELEAKPMMMLTMVLLLCLAPLALLAVIALPIVAIGILLRGRAG